MTAGTPTEKEKRLAEKCLYCPLCNYARKKQRGLAFWFLKKVESRLCPYCRAYEKVYHRPAHEPISSDEH